MNLYCPDCGTQTLEVVESTKPDAGGEFKDICTCTECEVIVYIIRIPSLPKGV